MNALIGKKQYQIQGFLQDGTRVPISYISVMGNTISQLKTQEKEGYNALQIAFDIKKKPNKAIAGHWRKATSSAPSPVKQAGSFANASSAPRFFREIRVDDVSNLEPGLEINPSDIFKQGDIVDVTGISKGKGFAGVVKRHGFKGGPRTHGQSDRERAPGSIGQSTTPGHVYKGKRMAGRMGHEKVTVKNLQVLEITNDGLLLIKGLVPGGKNTLVVVKKVGESKKFVPLYKEKPIQSDSSASQPSTLQDDAQPGSTKTQDESQASLSESRLPEAEEKVKTEEQSVLNSPASEQPPVASENQTQKEVKEENAS